MVVELISYRGSYGHATPAQAFGEEAYRPLRSTKTEPDRSGIRLCPEFEEKERTALTLEADHVGHPLEPLPLPRKSECIAVVQPDRLPDTREQLLLQISLTSRLLGVGQRAGYRMGIRIIIH